MRKPVYDPDECRHCEHGSGLHDDDGDCSECGDTEFQRPACPGYQRKGSKDLPKTLETYAHAFERLLWHRYLIDPNDCIDAETITNAFAERDEIEDLVESVTEDLDRVDESWGVHHGKTIEQAWARRAFMKRAGIPIVPPKKRLPALKPPAHDPGPPPVFPAGIHAYNDTVKVPGLYIAFFHGRNHPNSPMDDWGYDGPMIGPVQFVHTTYDGRPSFQFINEKDAERFIKAFPEIKGDIHEYEIPETVEGMWKIGGHYYGDMTIFYPEAKCKKHKK
jgi:hypothetical protein